MPDKQGLEDEEIEKWTFDNMHPAFKNGVVLIRNKDEDFEKYKIAKSFISSFPNLKQYSGQNILFALQNNLISNNIFYQFGGHSSSKNRFRIIMKESFTLIFTREETKAVYFCLGLSYG